VQISRDAAFVLKSEYRAPSSGGIPGMFRAEIGVRDSAVQRDLPGFDGQEKPFALVPQCVGTVRGQAVYDWVRVAGQYEGSSNGVDYYKFEAPRMESDLKQGVAFGLDVNVSPNDALWLQGYGGNYAAPLTGYGW
jgi:hypothetical protein